MCIRDRHVYGQGRQPFLPADNVGGSHKVVVHNMGKVVGGNAVRLQEHKVLIVLGNVQGSSCLLYTSRCV